MYTITLKNLIQKLGLSQVSVSLDHDQYLSRPVLDTPICIDESLQGMDAVIDGRKRLMKFIFLARQKQIPWDYTIKVYAFHSKKLAESTPETFELPGLNTSILNPEYIRNFLLLNQEETSEKQLTPDVLADFIRQIYRFLQNSLRSNHTKPFDSMELVSKLNMYLNQSRIAEILHRSEAWVSSVIAVSKLPLYMREAGQSGLFSFSNAMVIAKAESAREREILFELAHHFDYRTLVAIQRYLETRPDLIEQKNAAEKIRKIFSPKIVDVEKNMRIRLDVSVQRSLRKFLRARMAMQYNPGKYKPGKDPQSLVFRLKIVLDGEEAQDLTEITPQDIEKMRKVILDGMKELGI